MMTVNTGRSHFLSFMSIRLYIGNLPQTFEEQELVALLKSVGEGFGSSRFSTAKPVHATVSASPTWTIRNWPTP